VPDLESRTGTPQSAQTSRQGSGVILLLLLTIERRFTKTSQVSRARGPAQHSRPPPDLYAAEADGRGPRYAGLPLPRWRCRSGQRNLRRERLVHTAVADLADS